MNFGRRTTYTLSPKLLIVYYSRGVYAFIRDKYTGIISRVHHRMNPAIIGPFSTVVMSITQRSMLVLEH